MLKLRHLSSGEIYYCRVSLLLELDKYPSNQAVTLSLTSSFIYMYFLTKKFFSFANKVETKQQNSFNNCNLSAKMCSKTLPWIKQTVLMRSLTIPVLNSRWMSYQCFTIYVGISFKNTWQKVDQKNPSMPHKFGHYLSGWPLLDFSLFWSANFNT